MIVWLSPKPSQSTTDMCNKKETIWQQKVEQILVTQKLEAL